MSSCKPGEPNVRVFDHKEHDATGKQSISSREELTGERANVHKRTRAAPNAQNTCRQVRITLKNFCSESEVPVPPMTLSFMYDS